MKNICLDIRFKTKSGASSYIFNLLPRLSNDRTNGYQFFIIKYSDQELPIKLNEAKLIHSPSHLLLAMLWDFFILPIILKTRHIDLLHSMKSPIFLFSPCPYILTLHSLTTKNYQGKYPLSVPTRLYYYFFGNTAIKKADRVIAVSNYLKNYLVAKFKRSSDNVDVIYHGIDPKFEPLHQGKLYMADEVPLNCKYFLSVGNFAPVKNHVTTIRAFSRLNDKDKLKLIIIGKKNNTYLDEMLIEILRCNVRKQVLLPGFISGDHLIHLLNNAIALVMPSLTEGAPIAMIEAFRCGLPVIASKRGGLWDLGKDTALFVDDPMDFCGFSVQMEKIYASQAYRSNICCRSSQRAECFSWQKSARDHLAAYQRCLTKRSTQPYRLQSNLDV